MIFYVGFIDINPPLKCLKTGNNLVSVKDELFIVFSPIFSDSSAKLHCIC